MMQEEKFLFLEEEQHCYDIKEEKKQVVYRFKEGGDRGIIGIPKNEEKFFWYKYFRKGDNDSFKKNTPMEQLPLWFKELVEHSSEVIEKRDRIRKIFRQNYLQKDYAKTK